MMSCVERLNRVCNLLALSERSKSCRECTLSTDGESRDQSSTILCGDTDGDITYPVTQRSEVTYWTQVRPVRTFHSGPTRYPFSFFLWNEVPQEIRHHGENLAEHKGSRGGETRDVCLGP